MKLSTVLFIFFTLMILTDSVESRVRSRSRSRARARARAHRTRIATSTLLRSRRSRSRTVTQNDKTLINLPFSHEPEFFGWNENMSYGVKAPKQNMLHANDIACGKWYTIEDLAYECQFNVNCTAFTTRILPGHHGHIPWCMKQALGNTATVSAPDHDVYFMRSDPPDTRICPRHDYYPEFYPWYAVKMLPKTDLTYTKDIVCGRWGTQEEIALACMNNKKCIAYTMRKGRPWCMKSNSAFTREQITDDHDLYYIRSVSPRYSDYYIKESSNGNGIFFFFLFCISLVFIFC